RVYDCGTHAAMIIGNGVVPKKISRLSGACVDFPGSERSLITLDRQERRRQTPICLDHIVLCQSDTSAGLPSEALQCNFADALSGRHPTPMMEVRHRHVTGSDECLNKGPLKCGSKRDVCRQRQARQVL